MSYVWNASKYKSSSKLQKNVGEELLKYVQISEGDYILDAGCGVGNFTVKIASKAPKGHVIGIDSSASMINKCIEATENTDISNVEFINISLVDISYVNKFNIIFSNSVLHWVKDIEGALHAFSKALKPGGHIALQFPLLNESHPLIYLTNRVIEKLELNDYYDNWDNPWYVTDEEKFKSNLNNAGFNNVKVSKKESSFRFDSVKEAYDFFDSVGLKLFLDNLPEEKKSLFVKEFNKYLQESSVDRKIEFNFERIFAFADKSK